MIPVPQIVQTGFLRAEVSRLEVDRMKAPRQRRRNKKPAGVSITTPEGEGTLTRSRKEVVGVDGFGNVFMIIMAAFIWSLMIFALLFRTSCFRFSYEL